MVDKVYVLLIVGIFAITAGLLMARKDKKDFLEFEERLIQKENDLIELYDAIIGLMDDIQRIYNKEEKNNKAAAMDEETGYTNPSQIIALESDISKEQENGTLEGMEKEESLIVESLKKEEWSNLDKEAKVLYLNSMGCTKDEIAKRLKIGKGEVKLILKLSNNGG